MSCIATSVGLGNIWRFPYTAYTNGGGAFLIPYIIILIIVGKPFYYLEVLLGQFTSKSCVKVWAMSPAMKGAEVVSAMHTYMHIIVFSLESSKQAGLYCIHIVLDSLASVQITHWLVSTRNQTSQQRFARYQTFPSPFLGALSLPRYRIRPAGSRAVRGVVLLFVDGHNHFLLGWKFPVRITVVQVSRGMGSELLRLRRHNERYGRDRKRVFAEFRGALLPVRNRSIDSTFDEMHADL